MARQVRIEILGDARGLRRAFSEADRASTGFAKGIAKAGVFAATGLAGIVAGVGVAAGKSIQAAQESNKVSKQTAAVIKSTGGAAKLTAKQVGDLATAISNKTGIDDEAVQSSENLLLTFTRIRNVAGKNNDIFTQATKITQDMSVALGQSGTQSAIQLGKALQDPIKGVTALRRVGVDFTASQQKQIKTLVESGKTLDAQKLILRELGREFGGSAAAAATPLDKLKVIVGNVSESVGNLLLPIVNKAATWLGTRLPAAVTLLQTGLHALVGAFREGDVTSDGFVGVMERIGVALRVVVPAVQRFASEQLPRLQHAAEIAGKFISGTLVPALVAIFKWINEHKTLVQSLAVGILAVVAAIKVWSVITKTMIAVQTALNIVLDANPIGLVILAIAGLAAGIIYAYKHSETFRRIVDTAFRAIKAIVLTVVDFIIKAFRGWFDTSTTVVLGIIHLFGKLPGPLGAPFRAAETAVRKAKTTVDTQLDKIQMRVDQLRGKDIPISASLKLQFTKSFTQKDWVDVRLAAGRMAAGGMVKGPGGPTSDRVPALLSNGEFVVNAAAVRSIGVNNMKQLNAMRFAGGGPVGQIDSESRAINKVQAFGTGQRMERGINKIMSLFGAGAGGGNLGQWILAAIGITGVPISWAAPLRRRAMFESGGNPRAINLTDINALMGHPSKGLMQTIDSTFNAYAWDGLRNIWNPVHNLVAAIRYILSRYGSIFAIDPPVRGYDRGGYLPPGLSLAYNGTGRPEPVGGGGVTVNVTIGTVIGSDLRKASADLLQGIREDLRRRGKAATANLL